MLRLTLALCLIASASSAEDIHIDGFGVLPTSGLTNERLSWSGVTGLAKQSVIDHGEVDRLHVLAGPKSLVAGRDKGHVVALAVDEFGNLVAERCFVHDTKLGTKFNSQTVKE